MWSYEKHLQYPVRIARTNPRLAQAIISQYGGPDGELGASLRYLSQRFSMPYARAKAALTDIGTEELAHLEIVGSIIHQLTRDLTPQEAVAGGFEAYLVDHTTGVYPQAASGMPFSAAALQVKGDPITDLSEDMAAEMKARTTYDNILRISDDPDVNDVIRFLRQRVKRADRTAQRPVKRIPPSQRPAGLPPQLAQGVHVGLRGESVLHTRGKLLRFIHEQGRAAGAAHQRIHGHKGIVYIVVIADHHIRDPRQLQGEFKRAQLVPLSQRRDVRRAPPSAAERLLKRRGQPVIKSPRLRADFGAAIPHRVGTGLVFRREFHRHGACTRSLQALHGLHRTAAPRRSGR